MSDVDPSLLLVAISERRSSKDVLSNELRRRMWEKRTDTYIKILKITQKVHPDKVTLDSVMGQASDGGDVVILPYLETGEWFEFSARVDALSSDEVRSPFSLRERCLDGWTWCLSKLISHRDEDDKFHLKSKEELGTANEAILTARYLLTEHIRSELRFENRPFPDVRYVAPDGFLGAITEIEGEAERLVRKSPRIRSYLKRARGVFRES